MGSAAIVTAIATLGLSGVAAAQIEPHSNGPIDIVADNADFSNQTCISTWSGSAEALQGTSRLRANVIKAFAKPKPQGAKPTAGVPAGPEQSGCGDTDKLEADGDVLYDTTDQIARGDHAVYTAADDQIVMTGDVIVIQGKNVVRGDKMIIHVKDRVAVMDSNAKGRGTPGRVRGVFYPNQQQQAGAPGAPAQSAAAPAVKRAPSAAPPGQ